MELLVGINVSADLEEQGLDFAEHGEKAYAGNLLHDADMELGTVPYTTLQKEQSNSFHLVTLAPPYSDETDLIAKLCDASARGSVAEVIKLLGHGAVPWKGDYDGRTPLVRYYTILRYLLVTSS